MAFKKKPFLLTGATQFLATAMVIETIYWPVILMVKRYVNGGNVSRLDLEKYDPMSLCSAVGDSRHYYQSPFRPETCGQLLF